MGDFKGLDVLARARRTGGRLKAGSVFGLPYVAEQPQGCHNIDLRLLVQARLADEAKIVSKKLSLQWQRTNGEEVKERTRLEYL
jgi:hypothetical protein